MQQFSILLDGNAVPAKDFSGAADTRVTQSQQSNAPAITYANTLTFYGQSRSYILNKLVYAANPQTASVSIKIYDNCCKDANGDSFLVFDGKTTRADINFCDPNFTEDCGVECTVTDASPTGEKIQCLRNVLITQREYLGRTSSGADTYRAAPQFGYYEETRPKAYMNIMLYLAFWLIAAFFPITLVISIFTLFLVDLSPIYNGILDSLLKKKYHKAPFIHSYLFNVCTLCGLSLRSSIFSPTGAYHNLTRLDTPYSEGARNAGADVEVAYRDFNSPNITVIELLDSLKELNISYTVTNNELIVERKDFFNSAVWIDFSARQSDVLELCFDAADESQPAGEIFKFLEDGSDKIGTESGRQWSGDIVDYNTPITPTLRGIRQTTIQYGTARFIGDGLDSVIENWTGSILAQLLTLGNISVQRGSMLMTTGTASAPKLLLWDGTSSMIDAKVEVANGLYNGRAWLNARTLPDFGVTGFYENLLKISDPRLNLIRNLQYTIRFSYICDDLRSLQYGQMISLPVNGANVIAKVENIEIDFAAREITISGVL